MQLLAKKCTFTSVHAGTKLFMSSFLCNIFSEVKFETDYFVVSYAYIKRTTSNYVTYADFLSENRAFCSKCLRKITLAIIVFGDNRRQIAVLRDQC